MSGTLKTISLICRVVVALIFLQTLYFKFTAAEESRYIFTTLMGAEYEAFGRIGSGIVELIAAILIVVPWTVPIGAVLSLGVISGAVLSHLTQLGIVVKDDGGTLFGLAVLVFVLSLVILLIHRRELPALGKS